MKSILSSGQTSSSFLNIQSFYVISHMRNLLHSHQIVGTLINFSESHSCPFYEWSRVYYKKDFPDIYPYDEISAIELSVDKFSRSSYKLFKIFFSLSSPHFLVLLIFFLSERSNTFLIFKFHDFSFWSFPTLHYEHSFFFQLQFHSTILAVYSYHLFESLYVFHFFANNFISFMYIRGSIFFLRFIKSVANPRSFPKYIFKWNHCHNE